MRGRRASLLCVSTFALAVLGASLLAAGGPLPALHVEPTGTTSPSDAEADGRRAETFLLDWVVGDARFELDADVHHRYPDSPHKEDSERYEVSWTCFALHDQAGKPAAARVTEILLAMGRRPELDDATARRIVFVLGGLPGSDALDLLCRIASGEDGDSPLAPAREEAVRALRFFGVQPGRDWFLIFGGRFGTVVHPARPERRATEVLFDLLERTLEDPSAVPDDVRREALDALPYHATPSLEKRALRLSERLPADDDVIDLLRRIATLATLERLAQLSSEGRGEGVRANAVNALGWSANAAAIPALLEALGDTAQLVREAADDALHRLAGDEVEPRWTRRETLPPTDPVEARAAWRTRFGDDCERFDPEKAARRDAGPGVYRFP